MTDSAGRFRLWSWTLLGSLLVSESVVLILRWLDVIPMHTATLSSVVTLIAWLGAAGLLFLLAAFLRHRRWYQFDIRALFAAIATLCVFLTCATLFSHARSQQRAVEAMQCAAEYDSLGPGWLRHLLGKDYFGTTVTKVFSDRAVFTDTQMKHLKSLPDVKAIHLPSTSITDEGLRSVAELNQLEELGLTNTQITDRGLPNLKQLSTLRRLVLTGTNVTDEGIKDLEKTLPQCRIER